MDFVLAAVLDLADFDVNELVGLEVVKFFLTFVFVILFREAITFMVRLGGVSIPS